MTDTHFIAGLASFTRFAEVADPSRFVPAPDGWRIYCCDIVNSTQAIQQGRYKAVNMLGAACIMAAINAAPGVDLAYVFGGDGATILAPDAVAPAIDGALTRTRALARQRFDLAMRVGAVPLAEIRARGADVRVAMFELSPGNRMAMFTGGGAAMADRLVKGVNAAWLLPDNDDRRPDLDGLSCRWEPLRARRDHMLCLLASATAAELEVRAHLYQCLIAEVEGILAPDVEGARPVQTDNLRFRWPPRGLHLERVATQGARPAWRHALGLRAQSFLQALADWSGQRIGDYDAPRYRLELLANSDYRRFDDALRLLLDCTFEQGRRIEDALAAAYRAGELVYGLHRSGSALMTCLLFDLRDKRHLHFIDGADGGFTLAARAMKAQKAGRAPG